MVFYKILGQPFIILGSAERAYDLFEKCSSNYSDRPRFPIWNEMLVSFSLYSRQVIFTRDLAGLCLEHCFPSVRIGVERAPSFLPWALQSERHPQVWFSSNYHDQSLSSSPAQVSRWLCASYPTVSVYHTAITEIFKSFLHVPVHLLRLYSSWLTEWT